jgi:hypothetical protein
MRFFSLLLALLATEAVAQPSSLAGSEREPERLAQGPSGSPVSDPSEPGGNVEIPRAPAEASTSADEDRWYSLYRGKKLGLELEVGGPDGAGLMVLFRPYWWLRANGGFAYNYLGAGIRGGLTLMPIQWAVTPTLNFDLGHYFSGDLTKFVSPRNDAERVLLSDSAYDFWSAQVGLEFGSHNGFVFYVRAGISHLSASPSAENVTRFLNSTRSSATSGRYLSRNDVNFTALLPSISLGLLIYIL